MKTYTPRGRCAFVCSYRHPLLKKINPFFRSLQGMADPAVNRTVRWTPMASALAVVLMVWNRGANLGVRCADALSCLNLDFTGHGRVGQTYNGLSKALVRQASVILPHLKTDLQKQMLGAWSKLPRVGKWRLLAVDGSKQQLPRTPSLEAQFGLADSGKNPMALITCIVEVFTGLPWDWVIDRGNGDEKSHLQQMIGTLPDDALLLADANYVGYKLWSTLINAHRHFLIRVGGNVSLLSDLWPELKMTCHGQWVYAWPVARQHKVPPLRLRLIKVGSADKPVYLLTNVGSVRHLSVPMASRAYRMRWGIELFYRSLKRTLGAAKIDCRTGQRATVQMHWTLLSLCILTLLGIEHIQARRIKPQRLSLAALLRAVRGALLGGRFMQSLRQAYRMLDTQLKAAFTDNYLRQSSKASRHRPVTRDTPTVKHKPPKIRQATQKEKRLAKQMYPDAIT